MKFFASSLVFILSCNFYALYAYDQRVEYVTIAILAKDKAHTLPLYLKLIEKQTWPADKTYLYIRTNNNNDNTAELLRQWIEKVREHYAGIYFDDSDVEQQVQKYAQHEWNEERLKVLSAIRQASLQWAYEHASHYFVVDCDNFIVHDTIESLAMTHLPIVAPLLITEYQGLCCTNFHAEIDDNGCLKRSFLANMICKQQIKGLIELPVVHCAYFIRHELLNKLTYDDGSGLHEYLIFSKSARKAGIPQYLDARKVYGVMTFAETVADLKAECWYSMLFEGEIPD